MDLTLQPEDGKKSVGGQMKRKTPTKMQAIASAFAGTVLGFFVGLFVLFLFIDLDLIAPSTAMAVIYIGPVLGATLGVFLAFRFNCEVLRLRTSTASFGTLLIAILLTASAILRTHELGQEALVQKTAFDIAAIIGSAALTVSAAALAVLSFAKSDRRRTVWIVVPLSVLNWICLGLWGIRWGLWGIKWSLWGIL